MIGVGLFVQLACHLGETFNIVIIFEVMSMVDVKHCMVVVFVPYSCLHYLLNKKYISEGHSSIKQFGPKICMFKSSLVDALYN